MPSTKTPATNAVPPVEATSLDQVRDILFGAQARALETRLMALDQRVTAELEQLREIMLDKLESLEAAVRKQHTALERDFENRTGSLDTELNTKLSDVEDQLKRSAKELEKHLREQNTRLSNEIQRVQNASLEELERARETLSKDKADRAALADLFAELSNRLRDESSS